MTFPPPHRIDLKAHGIDEIQAADLRARLKTFAADWDDPEMDVYDELGPHEALELLKRLEAPVAPVETMIEESVRGRDSRSAD